MATHQTLTGVSDEEFLQRLLTTYPERFGKAFWFVIRYQTQLRPTHQIFVAAPADRMS